MVNPVYEHGNAERYKMSFSFYCIMVRSDGSRTQFAESMRPERDEEPCNYGGTTLQSGGSEETQAKAETRSDVRGRRKATPCLVAQQR